MLEEVFQRLGQLVVQKKDSREFQIRIIIFFKDCLNKIDQFNEIILNCDVIGMIGNIMLHSGLVYMHDPVNALRRMQNYKNSLKPYEDIKEKINPDDPIYICFDLITRIILSSGKEATFFKKLHFVYTIPFLKR